MQKKIGDGEIIVQLRTAAVIQYGLPRRGVELRWDETLAGGSSNRRTLRTIEDRRWLRRKRNGDQAGKNDEEGKEHLRNRRNEGSAPRGSHGVSSHGALHDEEVRAPISKREHESKTHGQAEPLDAQAVRVRAAQANPRMHIRRAERELQTRPATHVL